MNKFGWILLHGRFTQSRAADAVGRAHHAILDRCRPDLQISERRKLGYTVPVTLRSFATFPDKIRSTLYICRYNTRYTVPTPKRPNIKSVKQWLTKDSLCNWLKCCLRTHIMLRTVIFLGGAKKIRLPTDISFGGQLPIFAYT